MKNMFSKGAHPSEFGHRQTTMLMLGLFLLVSQCLFAQSRIIKGTVYDEHKDALIGASVILKGTSQGTITDIDGNFSVEASDKNTVLIVSYIKFILHFFIFLNHYFLGKIGYGTYYLLFDCQFSE